MKISECTYCGMLAITDQGVCSSCVGFLPSETPKAAGQDVAQLQVNPFEQTAQTVAVAAPMDAAPVDSTPTNTYVPQTAADSSGYAHSEPTTPVMDARCVKCKTLIARGQYQCFDCENKKSSPLKFVAAFAIIAVLFGFFGFDYVYASVSPYGIFKKYAKTTGADDSLVFENFVLSGDTTVSVDAPPGFSGAGLSGGEHLSEDFTFKMIFKKPSMSSIEFMHDGDTGKYTAFKQVFDGARGWKYMHMPNQPAGYQDADDGFAYKKIGLGLDEYDSLEFMNEAAAQQFGKDNIKALTDIKAVEVTDISKPSGEKTIVLGKQKRTGKSESSLLVFDRQTGLLLGIIKNSTVNNNAVTTIIYFDKYARFPVKRQGFLGSEETRVLMPTKMSFVTKAGNSGQVNGMPVITIELNVKDVEINAAIDNNYFTR